MQGPRGPAELNQRGPLAKPITEVTSPLSSTPDGFISVEKRLFTRNFMDELLSLLKRWNCWKRRKFYESDYFLFGSFFIGDADLASETFGMTYADIKGLLCLINITL